MHGNKEQTDSDKSDVGSDIRVVIKGRDQSRNLYE